MNGEYDLQDKNDPYTTHPTETANFTETYITIRPKTTKVVVMYVVSTISST